MSQTILVVDDEMLIALDIQIQLEARGHRAMVARTIAEALNTIETQQVNLVILDWHVGPGDSTPLARALVAKGIPFVVCSGSMIDEVAEAFTGVPYVPKPFLPEQLEDALAKATRLN